VAQVVADRLPLIVLAHQRLEPVVQLVERADQPRELVDRRAGGATDAEAGEHRAQRGDHRVEPEIARRGEQAVVGPRARHVSPLKVVGVGQPWRHLEHADLLAFVLKAFG
jgi:hypothetical protein